MAKVKAGEVPASVIELSLGDQGTPVARLMNREMTSHPRPDQLVITYETKGRRKEAENALKRAIDCFQQTEIGKKKETRIGSVIGIDGRVYVNITYSVPAEATIPVGELVAACA